jgi:hypothetical protein
MADWQMVGKLNGGSMILSSAWTCVIWVSRFGDEGDQRALVQNKWHEQLALVRSSTLGRILSRSREQAASPISPSPVPYWRYGAEHGPQWYLSREWSTHPTARGLWCPSGRLRRSYHAYSTTDRGVEFLMGCYGILDRAPKGRNEGGGFQLWICRHDEYDHACTGREHLTPQNA